MNIFFLSADATENAKFYCNAHVVKIILEITQMLWAAWGTFECNTIPSHIKRYKVTHKNHPMNIWVRTSKANYIYAATVGLELCKEYTFRYKKQHKCQQIIEWLIQNCPLEIFNIENPKSKTKSTTIFSKTGFPPHVTPIPLCMPVEYHDDNVITAYRNYYMGSKTKIAQWKGRSKPVWFI